MSIYFNDGNFLDKCKPFNIDFPYFETLKELEGKSGLPYNFFCGKNF